MAPSVRRPMPAKPQNKAIASTAIKSPSGAGKAEIRSHSHSPRTPRGIALMRQTTTSKMTSKAWTDMISQWILFMATILAAGQCGCE